MLLEGKTAIVTGGTRGIGYAVVRKFLENGASVALWGSRKETVDKALARLREEKGAGRVIGMFPDLQDMKQIQAAVAEVKEAFGRIDILVNNAGISARDDIYDYKPEDFDSLISLNVNAVFKCTKAVVLIMKEQGGGTILNTSSVVSLYGQAAGCGYPASKYAVNGLTKSLARELGRDHIRVNAVAPGVIRTDMVAALPEEIIRPLEASIPIGRAGEPEEVANAFLFLASSLASYVTGAVLSVDGAVMP